MCVCLLNDEQMKVNDMCHKAGVCYISCDARGVFAYAFCDFGDAFVVSDTDGNQVLTLRGGIKMAIPAWSHRTIQMYTWYILEYFLCVCVCSRVS